MGSRRVRPGFSLQTRLAAAALTRKRGPGALAPGRGTGKSTQHSITAHATQDSARADDGPDSPSDNDESLSDSGIHLRDRNLALLRMNEEPQFFDTDDDEFEEGDEFEEHPGPGRQKPPGGNATLPRTNNDVEKPLEAMEIPIVDGAIISILDMNELKRSLVGAEEATRGAQMLSKASELLASSLDYEKTIDALARLSTAEFADWCAVDLVNDDGTIRHLTVSHADPAMRDLAMEFQETAFREAEYAPGAPQALRSRESILLNDLAEVSLTGIHPEAKITQLISALGVRSLISVPLVVRGKVLGTITFSSSSRRYEIADLRLAEALCLRAATAIDAAMLFREAESANRYKDTFLGTVAHELRTPLASIIGWVQLAKLDPGKQQQAFVSIEESAGLIRLFVEDLLDLARIREQKLSMDWEEVDVAAVVRSALAIIGPSADAGRIEIALDLGLDTAAIRGDRVRLLQVVWNLLGNAIKFTPAGGRIDVRLDRTGEFLRLEVADTGVGISPDMAPRVFDLYSQGDIEVTTSPGMGIGLSIASQIVRLHGGTVQVESQGRGRGSTFVVTLPALASVPSPGIDPSERRSGRRRRSKTPATPGVAQEIS